MASKAKVQPQLEEDDHVQELSADETVEIAFKDIIRKSTGLDQSKPLPLPLTIGKDQLGELVKALGQNSFTVDELEAAVSSCTIDAPDQGPERLGLAEFKKWWNAQFEVVQDSQEELDDEEYVKELKLRAAEPVEGLDSKYEARQSKASFFKRFFAYTLLIFLL